jgi:hypothetical protein
MLSKEHGFNFHNSYVLSWYQSHLKDTRLELWLIPILNPVLLPVRWLP